MLNRDGSFFFFERKFFANTMEWGKWILRVFFCYRSSYSSSIGGYDNIKNQLCWNKLITNGTALFAWFYFFDFHSLLPLHHLRLLNLFLFINFHCCCSLTFVIFAIDSIYLLICCCCWCFHYFYWIYFVVTLSWSLHWPETLQNNSKSKLCECVFIFFLFFFFAFAKFTYLFVLNKKNFFFLFFCCCYSCYVSLYAS